MIIQKSSVIGWTSSVVILIVKESLNQLHDESADTTYFLSVPPERYENGIINLKEAGFLDDPDHSRVVIEKPFGHDSKST